MGFDKVSVATASRDSPKWSHEYTEEPRLPTQLASLTLPQYLPFNGTYVASNKFDHTSSALEYTLERLQTSSTRSNSTDSPLTSQFPKRIEPAYHTSLVNYPPVSQSASYSLNPGSVGTQSVEHYSSRSNSTVSEQCSYPSYTGLSWSVSMYNQARPTNATSNYNVVDAGQGQDSSYSSTNLMNDYNSPRTRVSSDSVTCGEMGRYIRDMSALPASGTEGPLGEPCAGTLAQFDSAITITSSGAKKRPRKRLSPSQRLAHNTIEKRYRVKINAKIAELNKIVPLHIPGSDSFSEDAMMGQGNAVNRLNKSLTLERATEYITHLITEKSKLELQIKELTRQLEFKSSPK